MDWPHRKKKRKSTHVIHMVVVNLLNFSQDFSNYMLAGSCHVGHPVRVKLISQEKNTESGRLNICKITYIQLLNIINIILYTYFLK